MALLEQIGKGINTEAAIASEVAQSFPGRVLDEINHHGKEMLVRSLVPSGESLAMGYFMSLSPLTSAAFAGYWVV